MFSLCSCSLTRLASRPGNTKACDFKSTNVLENTLIGSILLLKNEHMKTVTEEIPDFVLPRGPNVKSCCCYSVGEVNGSPSMSAFNVGGDYQRLVSQRPEILLLSYSSPV